MDASTTFQRMKRLQKDGLVTRTGSRWGDPYVLTEAGQALGPVYAAVGRWSAPVPHRASTSAAPPAPTAHREAPTSVGRTAAALGRSPAAPPSLFSHAPQPQPRVPPPSPCVRACVQGTSTGAERLFRCCCIPVGAVPSVIRRTALSEKRIHPLEPWAGM
ncbi:hypothetical protein [Streptomyces sp. NPDC059783]|uniref:hypothetical protein n=1 Tax=Streptomyces sp. NPDC059783 TaxID=3346944 RepID=UPI0036566980